MLNYSVKVGEQNEEADAFAVALRRTNRAVTKVKSAKPEESNFPNKGQ